MYFVCNWATKDTSPVVISFNYIFITKCILSQDLLTSITYYYDKLEDFFNSVCEFWTRLPMVFEIEKRADY